MKRHHFSYGENCWWIRENLVIFYFRFRRVNHLLQRNYYLWSCT